MEKPTDIKTFETSIATNWLDDNGWFCSISKNAPHTLEALKNHFEMVAEVLENRPTNFLVFPDFAQSIDSKSRRYLDEVIPKYTKKCAYVCYSDMMRIGINIFFRISKSVVPMKVFPTEEKAIAWLKEQ